MTSLDGRHSGMAFISSSSEPFLQDVLNDTKSMAKNPEVGKTMHWHRRTDDQVVSIVPNLAEAVAVVSCDIGTEEGRARQSCR